VNVSKTRFSGIVVELKGPETAGSVGAKPAAHREKTPDPLDPLVAAPGFHRLLVENDRVRVLDVQVAPGQFEPMHRHRQSVIVVLQGGKARFQTARWLSAGTRLQWSAHRGQKRSPAGLLDGSGDPLGEQHRKPHHPSNPRGSEGERERESMTNRQLEGKVALITGAGRGIGRAIALGYAKEGASIAAASRTREELDSVVTEVKAFGGQAVAFPADLTDANVPARLVAAVVETLGGLDILVNNAGIGTAQSPRPVKEFDDDYWNLTLQLNLTAPYLLSKAVLPIFLEKRRGRIINIASVAGKIGLVHGAAYSASKHGLLGLTRALATEVASSGITVNAICPGPVRSAMNDQRIRHDAQRLGITLQELESRITPIGRRLEPEEIVPMAVLLAGEGSSGITGQAFNICGGLAMF